MGLENLQIYNEMVREQQTKRNRELAKDQLANRSYEEAMALKEAARKKRLATTNKYPGFKKSVQEHFVYGFLETVCDMVMDRYVSDYGKTVCHNAIQSYVSENGAMNILNTMNGKTLFLSEAALYIDKTIDSVLEEVEPENPESYAIDPKKDEEFYDDLSNSEEISDIINTIRARVVDAEERMATDNIKDKMDMDEIVASAKDRVEAVRQSNSEGEMDDSVAEAIQQEAVTRSKVQMNRVSTKRTRSVLEQMVRSNAREAMKNPDLAKVYTENGVVDYDKLIESTVAVYTFIEALNTMCLEDYDAKSVQALVS